MWHTILLPALQRIAEVELQGKPRPQLGVHNENLISETNTKTKLNTESVI